MRRIAITRAREWGRDAPWLAASNFPSIPTVLPFVEHGLTMDDAA